MAVLCPADTPTTSLNRPRRSDGRLKIKLSLGAFALLGLRGSPYWLAGGWAIHPIWDVVLHFVGAGHTFAPETWTIPCASFDLLVAAYIAIAHRFGLTQRNGERPRSRVHSPSAG